MLWLELSIFLGCILLGVRTGGIGMGTIAGVGLAIFVFNLIGLDYFSALRR